MKSRAIKPPAVVNNFRGDLRGGRGEIKRKSLCMQIL
jgi:hypothetical protein